MDTTFNIQLASRISNVGVHTIRIWERRYKAVSPERDHSGHRNYTKSDIEKLSLLNELCKMGFSISKIAHLDNEQLKERLQDHGKQFDYISSISSEIQLSENEIEEVLIISLMALKAYRLDIVSKELNKLKKSLNGRQFALNVALPLMEEMGLAVASGEYTISHEHALSSIMKFHLGHFLYTRDISIGFNKKKIVICGMEGDLHEFGILIAAVLCNYHHLEFFYLGPNLPAESIADAALFLEAELVVVGLTSFSSHLEPQKIKTYIETVLGKIPEDVNLLLGSSQNLTVHKKFSKRFQQIKSLENFDLFLKDLSRH
jgi:DNA-binding transcriptional MerR regulator